MAHTATAEAAKKKKAEERRRQEVRDEAYRIARAELDERIYKLGEKNVDFIEIFYKTRAEIEKERAEEEMEESEESLEAIFRI